MLVLRRTPGETIYIGDDVIVSIVECGATWVRIGITAPRDIAVDRGEIRESSDYVPHLRSTVPLVDKVIAIGDQLPGAIAELDRTREESRG